MTKFIETPTFTRLVTALLSDDEYLALQNKLLENPECNDLSRAAGNSQVRFALRERGGVRVIYY